MVLADAGPDCALLESLRTSWSDLEMSEDVFATSLKFLFMLHDFLPIL